MKQPTVIDTYEGKLFTFYFVHEWNNEDSPFGDRSIVIPFEGTRSNCLAHRTGMQCTCTQCDLYSRNCLLPISRNLTQYAEVFPEFANAHPELFI